MQQRLANQKVKYRSEFYNQIDGEYQVIRLTDGCPRNCPYCYCPTEFKKYKLPVITKTKVRIMDMNFLSVPRSDKLICDLPEKIGRKKIHYEFTSGVDYRLLTNWWAFMLKKKNFVNIRIAWDWYYKDQIEIIRALKILQGVGYKPKNIQVFMLANWKISFEECFKKLFKINDWGVQIAQCYYDNQTMPNVEPIHWTKKEIKMFQWYCRKNNQFKRHYGIDPEIFKK